MAGYSRPDPVKIVFSGTHSHRGTSASKDFRYLNCLTEVVENKVTDEKKVYLFKRDGTTQYSYPPAAAAVGRGIYYWAKTGKVYSVFGNKIYANTTAIQTINTSTGRVGFSENQGGTAYLAVIDGTDGWLINSSDTVSQISDVDFPSATTYHTENIDGYTLVINTDTGAVHNSDIDDPSSWVSTNFITPEMYPDGAQALTRYKNMFVVFGRTSCEFFYNAANASGSPFSRAQQYSQEVGIAGVKTLARVNDKIFFVGQNVSGNRSVYTIEKDKFNPISPDPYNRILNSEGSDISNADAMIVNFNGHPCYALSLNTADRTFCYDMSSEQWFEIDSSSAKFAYLESTHIDTGLTLVQHRTNGKIYSVSPTIYQDDGSNFTCSVVTNLVDLGTNKRKFLTRLDIMGDRPSASSNLSVSWSDDDYQTFSTARTVDLTKHTFLRNCGTFRRRAFKLSYSDNYPLRLEFMELEVDIGDY